MTARLATPSDLTFSYVLVTWAFVRRQAHAAVTTRRLSSPGDSQT